MHRRSRTRSNTFQRISWPSASPSGSMKASSCFENALGWPTPFYRAQNATTSARSRLSPEVRRSHRVPQRPRPGALPIRERALGRTRGQGGIAVPSQARSVQKPSTELLASTGPPSAKSADHRVGEKREPGRTCGAPHDRCGDRGVQRRRSWRSPEPARERRWVVHRRRAASGGRQPLVVIENVEAGSAPVSALHPWRSTVPPGMPKMASDVGLEYRFWSESRVPMNADQSSFPR